MKSKQGLTGRQLIQFILEHQLEDQDIYFINKWAGYHHL